VIDDREPQARAAALGGEIRQKQFFLVSGRLRIHVSHNQLSRFRQRWARVDTSNRFTSDFAHLASAGLSTEIRPPSALELIRDGHIHRRRLEARSTPHRSMPSQASLENIQRRCERSVCSRTAPAGRPESGETAKTRRRAFSTDSTSREMVAAHSRRMRSDSGACPPRSNWRAILSAHSGDRRQEDFRFVRDPARHFVPSRRFLRPQAVRWCLRGRTTNPGAAECRTGSAETVMARCRTWPGDSKSIWLAATPVRQRALHQILDFGHVVHRK